MSFRQPAEFEPHESVWIGFPSAPDLWLDDLEGAQAEVAAFARAVHAGGKGEHVRLVCANGLAEERAHDLVGAAAEIVSAPFFDIWLRDTGPVIVTQRAERFALDHRGNGWGGKYPSPLDDALAAHLCGQTALNRVPRHWVLEGGAIDVDGAGWLVTTEQCLLNPNRNPTLSRAEITARLRADFGARDILWLGDGLAGDHTDGHVDNIARFVAPGLLALPETASADDPNGAVFADALSRAAATDLRTVMIPSVGLLTDEDGTTLAASHMNFYIGNAVVVVPTYGTGTDAAAVAAVTALFPDRETIGLPANHLLTGGGSFHCISQQVPSL
jgi:agmatine deiminase